MGTRRSKSISFTSAELLFDDAAAPATVIIDHLRRHGYGGGITILNPRGANEPATCRARSARVTGGSFRLRSLSAKSAPASHMASSRRCRTRRLMQLCSAFTRQCRISSRAAWAAWNVSAAYPTGSWSTTTPQSSSLAGRVLVGKGVNPRLVIRRCG